MTQSYILIALELASTTILGILLIFYKFIYPKKNINLLVLTILISILPVISIFRPGTYQSSDLTLHSTFLHFFYDNLQDGILVPRWAGNDCSGYGCPIFLFQYVLPYYMGAVFHFIGFSYLNSTKLVVASTYILSGITMYWFLKDEINSKAAFTGSVLFLFAPIRFIYMHFLVSIGICVSCMFIPLAFLFAKKTLTGNIVYIVLYSICCLLLILAHSSIAFITIPASFLYAFIKKKKITQMLYPTVGAILGLGISSYYILPAIYEFKYDWLSFLVSVHDFKPFLQYIYSPVWFGLLFQGHQGELRLIVGYTQLLIFFYTVFLLIRHKFNKHEIGIVIFLLIYTVICFTLLQRFTKPVWNSIFFLKSFVEPWRLLVPISFFIAFLGAILSRQIKTKYLAIFLIISILYTILNWGNRQMAPPYPNDYYHQPMEYSEYVDPGNPIYIQRYRVEQSLIPELNQQRVKSPIQILSGSGATKEIARTQIYHEYIVYAATPLLLSDNTYYFPGWNVYENGEKVALELQNNKSFGTLVFRLKKGIYLIQARFENTPIETTGKYISETSFTILIVLLLYFYFNKYQIRATSHIFGKKRIN